MSNRADLRVPVLPVRAYTDPAWFAREQAEIFGKTWQFAGFTEDVAAPGDYVTVQCGPSNIFVVKGHDQRLRAFHNLCRHRGTQLLRAVGRGQKAISCPYHDWTYGLDGALLSVPDEARQFPDLDKSLLCLHPAAVDTWRGLVFVNPDPEAEGLMHWFGGAEAQIMPHHPELLQEFDGARTTHEIAANWKIVAENYIDGYHLARLHSGTLSMYDHSRQETGFVGPHYLFYEPHTDAFANALPGAAEAPLIDHIEGAPAGAYVPLLFPNLGLSGTESSFSVFAIEPVAVDHTRVHLRSKLMPKGAAAMALQAASSWFKAAQFVGPKDPAFPADHPLGSGDFFAEDVYVCEAQQRSFASPRFAVGPTALHHEAGVRGFQQIVGEWLGAL